MTLDVSKNKDVFGKNVQVEVRINQDSKVGSNFVDVKVKAAITKIFVNVTILNLMDHISLR